MPLIGAFSRSINTIAVGLGEEVGRDTVIRAARRLGIRSRLDPQSTLALGTEVLTPLELTAAYVPFANGGMAITPYGFKRIRTRSGRILWERATPEPRRVIEDGPLRNMNLMLAQVVSAGTARAAQLPDRPVGGKTGTTSDYRDAWFIGFTGGYVAGVWVGNDNFGIQTNKVTGGSAPARIWKAFMVPTMKGVAARGFALPLTPPPDPNALAEPTDDNVETLPVDPVDVVAEVAAPTSKDVTPSSPSPSPGAPKSGPETRTLDEIVKDVQAKTNEPSGPPR
jgi:penicillin-binding protein 1A